MAQALVLDDRGVFDVSQTDAVDLPEMSDVSGDPGENLERLAAFLQGKGVQLVYNPNIAPALGMSYGGRIAILPGQSIFLTCSGGSWYDAQVKSEQPGGLHEQPMAKDHPRR